MKIIKTILENYWYIGLAVNFIFVAGESIFERITEGSYSFEGMDAPWYIYWTICFPILFVAWGFIHVLFWWISIFFLPVLIKNFIEDYKYKKSNSLIST